jgi:Fic family protein
VSSLPLLPDEEYVPVPPFEEWRGWIDEALWKESQAKAEAALTTAGAERAAAALHAAIRAAAFDTGAIEGLYGTDRGRTMTVAAAAPGWEREAQAAGSNVPELFKAQLAAYELATLNADADLQISEKWIREFHISICGAQETYRAITEDGKEHIATLPKGEYRTGKSMADTGSNRRIFAPPLDVAPEVHRFVTELSGADFAQAHPAIQASYAHYGISTIHPFADGNGRVARGLASVFFFRAARIPFIAFADQRLEYLAALSEADHGRPQAFIDFSFDRGIETMHLSTDLSQSDPAALSELRATLTTHGGLLHAELDRIGEELLIRLQTELSQKAEQIQAVPGTFVSLSRTGVASNEDPLFRLLTIEVRQTIQTSEPAPARAEVVIRLQIAKASVERYPFRLVAQLQGGELDSDARFLRIRLRDLHPSVTPALDAQLKAWVDAVNTDLARRLNHQAKTALASRGYA